MKGYTVNLNNDSGFRGITIMCDSIEKGLDYAQENEIDCVCIACHFNEYRKQRVNFDFLKGRDFIRVLHWLVPLDRRSNTESIRELQNLEELRWVAGNNVPIDLSSFRWLKKLNIQYSSKIIGWEYLTSLQSLMLSSVNEDGLSFLGKLESLETLRLLNGKLTSIGGLDGCRKLHTLFIQNCPALSLTKSDISKLEGLENLIIERCRLIDAQGLREIDLKNLLII